MGAIANRVGMVGMVVLSIWAVFHLIFELSFSPLHMFVGGASTSGSTLEEAESLGQLVAKYSVKVERFPGTDSIDVRFESAWAELEGVYDGLFFPTVSRTTRYMVRIAIEGGEARSYIIKWVLVETAGLALGMNTSAQLHTLHSGTNEIRSREKYFVCKVVPFTDTSTTTYLPVGRIRLTKIPYKYKDHRSIFGYRL
ncbi:MAG: hypothetical protein SGJ05_02870 [bacterium]|nr:hypothetical protein [bacterium]